jgi:uncharacterized protein YkwD
MQRAIEPVPPDPASAARHRHRRAVAGLLVAAGIAVGGCTAVPAGASGGRTAPAGPLEHRIHGQINAYRAGHGGRVLQRHDLLDRLAREHSRALLERCRRRGKSTVDHCGFQQRYVAAQAGLGRIMLAENVISHPGGGDDPAGAMVRGWIGSEGHRRNLAGAWSLTGVGVARDEQGRLWATQLFASAPAGGGDGAADDLLMSRLEW